MIIKKRNRARLLVGLTALLVASALIFTGCSKKLELSIGSEKITDEEFLNTMNSIKLDVANEITKGSNVNIDESFWKTEQNGELPYEVLADRVIEELKQVHAVYELAMEYGYIDSASYDEIYKRMEQENQRRSEAIENGEVVYGLSSFSYNVYLEYEMDSLQKAYCEDLTNPGMEVTEEESKAYYEENKDTMFYMYDDFTIQYVRVPYDGYLTDEEKNEIYSQMMSLYSEADTNIGDYIDSYPELKEFYGEEEILSDEADYMSKTIGDVMEIGYDLDAGEKSAVIDQNGYLFLVQCLSKTEHDYKPFEDVKVNIEKILREEHYDQVVEEKAESLQVDCNYEDIYSFTLENIN